MKLSGYIMTSQTGEWVPRAPAKGEAIVVYSEFAHNLGCAEDLSHLSLLARHDFRPDIAKKYLSDELEERLMLRGYLECRVGDLASRTTLRTTVAANMVQAELDEGTVAGYLVEPFVDREMLPELYKTYLLNRKRRQDPNLGHGLTS